MPFRKKRKRPAFLIPGPAIADLYLQHSSGQEHVSLHASISSPHEAVPVEVGATASASADNQAAGDNLYEEAGLSWPEQDTGSSRHCYSMLLADPSACPMIDVGLEGKQATFLVRGYDEEIGRLTISCNFTTLQLCHFSCGSEAVLSFCSCTAYGTFSGMFTYPEGLLLLTV